MFSFFTKKYIKVPIVSLVIVSLLLQFIPAPTPAKAFSIKDILNKILGAIQIPSELELTSDGSIEFGAWLAKKHWGGNGDSSVFNCLFKKYEYLVTVGEDEEERQETRVDLKFCGCKTSGKLANGDYRLKCGWRDNNDCRADCTNYRDPNCGEKTYDCCLERDFSKEGWEQCVNPFSTFRFGHHESQTDLIIQTGDREGSLAIPNPKTPLRCQLRIPLPDEDDTTTIEEKLAERKACNYFRSAQKAAAQVAYTAKKIFNNTDPLSTCFFLRTCKTSCSFRFGEVKYIITLLDVVRLFVGDASVALDVVQKVINLIRIFRAILELGGALKDLYQEGSAILGNLLDTAKNLATLGSSLREIGVKISDAFIFTPQAALAGQTQERTAKAYNGFIDLISNFASNLEKYQLAKSEALALVEQTQKDVEQIMEDSATITLDAGNEVEIAGFKNEPEIGFLFVKNKDPEKPENYEKKRQLDEIVANFQGMFQPISYLLEQIALLGDMFDGYPFSDLIAGTLDELYEKSIEKYKVLCCGEDYGDDQNPDCDHNAPWFGTDAYNNWHRYVNPEEYDGQTEAIKSELVEVMENYMTDEITTYFSPKRGTSVYANGEPFVPWEVSLSTQDITLDEEWFEDFCTQNGCWYDYERGQYCNVYSFKGDRVKAYYANYRFAPGEHLLTVDHINGVIYRALSEGNSLLNYWDAAWVEYWRELAYYCQGREWLNNILNSGKDDEEKHAAIREACTFIKNGDPNNNNDRREDWPQLDIIENLDGDTRVSNNEYIEGKIQEYKNYNPRFSFGTVTGDKSWFDTFQDIFEGVNEFRKIFKYLAPSYIKQNIISEALNAYDCSGDGDDYHCDKFAYERLNESKEVWRWYWERLGKLVLPKGRVDNIIKDNNMEDAHRKIRTEVVGVLGVLQVISNLNGGGKYDKEKGFNDSRIVKTFEGGILTDPETDEVTEFRGYNELFKDYFETREDQTAKIEEIKYNIDILENQDEYLRALPDERPNDYWESQMLWCGKGASFDTLSIDLEEQYLGTFEGSVVDYDWEKRIGFVVDAKPNLDVIKDALEYELGPSKPILIVYITRAKDKLEELADLYEKAIENLLGGIQGEIDNYCSGDKDTEAYKDYREYLHYYYCYRDGTDLNEDDEWDGCAGIVSCEDCKTECVNEGRADCNEERGDCRGDCNEERADCKDDCDDDEDDCLDDCDDGDDDCDDDCDDDEDDCDDDCDDDEDDCDDDCDDDRDDCYKEYTRTKCETNECSKGGHKPCWWKGEYKRRYQAELAKLNAECARRHRYFNYLQDSEELDINFNSITQAFENNFEPLQEAIEDLQYIWKKKVFANRESAVASSTIHKIVNTIAKSRKIVEDILPAIEAALTDLDALNEAEKYLNKGYCDFDQCTTDLANNWRCKVGSATENISGGACGPEEVSTKTWNKFLLEDEDNSDNSGIIVKFREEVEIAKRQIVNTIKIQAGTYSFTRYPKIDEYGNFSFPVGCPGEEDGGLFLNRIRCFEKDNKRYFEQLLDFVRVIESLENMSFAMDDLKGHIIDLEPSIDMQVVSGLKDKFDAIGENPITLLDGTFKAIRDIFRKISVLPLRTYNEAYLNMAWEKLKHINVFRDDQDRKQAYQSAIENLHEENITDLTGLIFREDDITQGCQALSMILNSDPRETRDRCLARSEDLIVDPINDFNDINSQKGCRALGELDLTLFTVDAEEEREALTAERNRLIDQRACIRKIRCDDPDLNSCITCPKWICEGIDDPYCFDENGDVHLKWVDNYNDGAIWDTNMAPPPEDDDRVKPDVCSDAGLGNVCEVSELRAQCAEFDAKDVDIEEFDNPDYGGGIAENTALINELEDELACITYEKCVDDYGSADELYGYTILKTGGKPCISCPRWICENLDDNLLTVDDPICATDLSGNLMELEGTLDDTITGDAGSHVPPVKFRGIVWSNVSADPGEWPRKVPSKLRKWPRPTACFDDSGSLPVPEELALNNKKSQPLTTELCIAKQKELRTLKEQTPIEVVFPWEEEDWPCKTIEACEKLILSCGKLEDGTAVELGPGWNQNQWPPRDPCRINKDDYVTSKVKGYSGAQTLCIQTQKDLGLYQTMLGEDPDADFDWVTKGLIDDCDTLAAQKSLKKECEHFEMLEKNVFPDKCGDFDDCLSDATDAYKAGRIVAPCKQYCEEGLRKKIWRSFCVSTLPGIKGVLEEGCNDRIVLSDTMPNLTLPTTPNNKPEEDLTEDELTDLNELRAYRQAVIEKCAAAAHNIEQPLDEVMKIFAILLGIKSATGLYSGVSILKSSTQKIIKDVQDFIAMIKGTPCKNISESCDCGECKVNENTGTGDRCSGGIVNDIQCLWKQIDEGISGADAKVDKGLKVNVLQCQSHPAVSYSETKDKKLTSNQGGPVCLGIGDLFQQIEGQFGVVRQNVRQIDLVRRGVKEGGFSIGRLLLNLWTEYPIVWHSFDDLYEKAKSIKTRTSYVWALANAVNFANKQCTCGQSYCKMPLCISGLPLAFAPVKNPYCYIVWIFRYPMLKVAENLGKFLEEQIK